MKLLKAFAILQAIWLTITLTFAIINTIKTIF